MSDLSESSLIVDLEVAKINEGSLGHLKFDFWKWLKRKWLKMKNAGGMYCLAKNREWKFDIWRWPKRKKRGVKCERQSTVRQGTHHKFAAKYYGPFVVIAKKIAQVEQQSCFVCAGQVAIKLKKRLLGSFTLICFKDIPIWNFILEDNNVKTDGL
nr:hypothetical protein [Tanacetum cinerariifolium]